MLRCRGRVTMLNLSRWSSKGGSYRSIQRFYNTPIYWLKVNWSLFVGHKMDPNEVYLLAGDETTVTKSGKHTFGSGRFFSSIHSRAVKGIGFFSLDEGSRKAAWEDEDFDNLRQCEALKKYKRIRRLFEE